jgi:hypothetical protein
MKKVTRINSIPRPIKLGDNLEARKRRHEEIKEEYNRLKEKTNEFFKK